MPDGKRRPFGEQTQKLPASSTSPYLRPVQTASGASITATLGVTLEGVVATAAASVYEVITSAAAPTLDGVALAASATVTTPAPAPTGPVVLVGLGLSVWNRWDG